jgi:peptidyl-prolyl cis-trans isomerase SurA
MFLKIFFKLILILLIFNSNTFSIENKILFKIENQIITSLDIENEYKYLIALNPNLKSSNKSDIITLSRDQLFKKK